MLAVGLLTEDFTTEMSKSLKEILTAFPPISWLERGIQKTMTDVVNLSNVAKIVLRTYDKAMEQQRLEKLADERSATSADPRMFSSLALKNLTTTKAKKMVRTLCSTVISFLNGNESLNWMMNE